MILRITYKDGYITERPVRETWVCCGEPVRTIEIVDRDVPASDVLWFGEPIAHDALLVKDISNEDS